MSMLGGGLEPGPDPCSRAGCRTEASWQVIWRNPRIHAPDRRKIWLACDEHAEYLRDYLAARDFPVELSPFPADAEHAPSWPVSIEGP
jgi:hypothetical protein